MVTIGGTYLYSNPSLGWNKIKVKVLKHGTNFDVGNVYVELLQGIERYNIGDEVWLSKKFIRPASKKSPLPNWF